MQINLFEKLPDFVSWGQSTDLKQEVELPKKTHKDMIVETLVKGWHCYGELMAANDFASSLPRSLTKFREEVCTSFRNTEKGLIGTLSYKGKVYNWYEKTKEGSTTKYFYLEELT
jgi:hypothetical protein